MFYPSNCNEIAQHDCGSYSTELGRIRAVAFVHKSYFSTLIADIENVNLWLIGRNNNKIFVYPEVNGEMDVSPIYSNGFAKAEETLIAYNFGIEFNIPEYVGNITHWNALRGSRNYYILFCTETQMHVTERLCSIVPRNEVKNDLKQEVIWSCSSKWTSDNFPLIYDKVEGAMDCNISVLEYLLQEDNFYLLQENLDRIIIT